MSSPAPLPPPGWYTNLYGQVQWWDGYRWGPLASFPPPAAQPVPKRRKETSTAYLLAFLVGAFGAHRFYLGLAPSALAMLALTVVGFPLLFVLLPVGAILLFAMAVWVALDFFNMPVLVRRANEPPGTSLVPRG